MLVWQTLNKNQPLGILLPHTFLNIWRLSYPPQWEQHKEEVEVHHIFVVKSILSSQISNMYVPIVYIQILSEGFCEMYFRWTVWTVIQSLVFYPKQF